jgi:HK97 family phage portal protein
MKLWPKRQRADTARAAQIVTAEELLNLERRQRMGGGGVAVTNDSALRHSAVWACLRLRADLVSTMPVDVYRRVQGIQVEVPKPPVLVTPGGDRVGAQEWMYSTQVDLDRGGNCFGLITERSGVAGPDGRGLPARIDLVALADVVVRAKGSQINKFVIAGTEYDPWDVWHEKQYTVAGLPLGLSPVAYAAWTIEESLNAQQFAKEWFAGGAIPMAELVNTAKTIDPKQARVAREAFDAAVSTGDLFVHGVDWEYKPIQAVASQSAFIEARQYGIGDIARFFGCPGDMIDAAASGSSITYANITQRNLQFLIMHLGPAVTRREDAFSRFLVSNPRYVKLNTDALLRMDPTARAQMTKTQIDSRTLTPSEAREYDNRGPLTEEDYAEFDRLFGSRNPAPATTPTPPGASS